MKGPAPIGAAARAGAKEGERQRNTDTCVHMHIYIYTIISSTFIRDEEIRKYHVITDVCTHTSYMCVSFSLDVFCIYIHMQTYPMCVSTCMSIPIDTAVLSSQTSQRSGFVSAWRSGRSTSFSLPIFIVKSGMVRTTQGVYLGAFAIPACHRCLTNRCDSVEP